MEVARTEESHVELPTTTGSSSTHTNSLVSSTAGCTPGRSHSGPAPGSPLGLLLSSSHSHSSAGGGVYLIKRSNDSGSGEVVTVMTEPVSTSSNPFTPPIPPGTGATTDVAVTTPVTTTSPVTVKGGNPGLFGGTQKATQCDKAKLIAFLAANPERQRHGRRCKGSRSPTFRPSSIVRRR